MGADAVGPLDCVWLVTSGERIVLQLPGSMRASFDPFVLTDSAGQRIAAQGDHVIVEAYDPDSQIAHVKAPPLSRFRPSTLSDLRDARSLSRSSNGHAGAKDQRNDAEDDRGKICVSW
jgi:hypothetical protein